MVRRSFLVLLFLASACSANAQRINVAELDTLFDRLARHQKLMGSVQLSKSGKILYRRGFGQAQVGQMTGIANEPETVYRIGSVSKMFTATMIMQLAAEKRLKLTDTILKWFPQIPNAAKITVDHLLTHHSGLHNFTQDTSFTSWQDTVKGRNAIIARIAAGTSDSEPGAEGAYSNTNFVLLGYIIECITGMPYAQALQKRIATPLKLTHTAFGALTIHPQNGEALSYSVTDGHWVAETLSSTEVAGGAGAIVSSVGDMAIFIEALMIRGFLPAASLKKMMEIKEGYGRGMIRFPFYGDLAYGHNGHIDNFSSMLAFFPKDSLVLSMACNAVAYDFNKAGLYTLSSYYGKPFSMPDFGKNVVLAPAQLQRVAGVYTSKDVGMDITVIVADGSITAQATGQDAFPLSAVSESEFTNDEVGIQLHFILSGNGPADKLMVLQGGGRIPFSRKK